jgi:hypothetical protein
VSRDGEAKDSTEEASTDIPSSSGVDVSNTELTIKILNTSSAGDADALIDEAFTLDGNQTSHHVTTPTGSYQAMLDQADKDFDGDGKDDPATYQPEADAAAIGRYDLDWITDYAPVSSPEFFLV